jgi:GxxExxY protein
MRMRHETFPDPQTFQIIGAAMTVHTELGSGFLERVYKAALRVEFETRGIVFAKEVLMPVEYKNRILPLDYKVDFMCFQEVLVEVKASDAIHDRHIAQLINYLKASRTKRGLLLNFGARSLEHRRIVN